MCLGLKVVGVGGRSLGWGRCGCREEGFGMERGTRKGRERDAAEGLNGTESGLGCLGCFG